MRDHAGRFPVFLLVLAIVALFVLPPPYRR